MFQGLTEISLAWFSRRMYSIQVERRTIIPNHYKQYSPKSSQRAEQMTTLEIGHSKFWITLAIRNHTKNALWIPKSYKWVPHKFRVNRDSKLVRNRSTPSQIRKSHRIPSFAEDLSWQDGAGSLISNHETDRSLTCSPHESYLVFNNSIGSSLIQQRLLHMPG